jgi:3-oxoadipate enol-lactonase
MSFIECNGHIVHYRYFDNKKEQTFLFINSLGTDFRIWDDVVTILEHHGNVLLYDKRGHGLSDVVESTKSLNDFADDAVALLDSLSIEKCIPVGVSVGGMIALILVDLIPGKVERLIFSDTRHKIGTIQSWNERIAHVQEKGIAAVSDSILQRWFSEKFRNEQPERYKGYKNMLERSPVPGYIKTCEAIREADLADVAKKIKVSSLCIVGSEDKSTLPKDVKDLADLIDGSEYEVIDSSGHLPCVDNPGAFSRLIIDFMGS